VDSTSISTGLLVSTVNLATFKPTGAPDPDIVECQFSDGLGYLFVTHPTLEPFYVDYDSATQVLTATAIPIKIRDLEGLADNLEVDERPSVTLGTVTAAHLYNLYNQGWTNTNLGTWDTARSDLPSNVDVMHRFKNSSNAFDTATVANAMEGTSAAPRGHFILDAFDQDRADASGVSVPDVTTGYSRPSACAFHAGRVFYAGTNYTGFNGKIFYSRVIETSKHLGQCYQDLDPTSEELYELLATDGGVINIPEVGTVFKLFSMQNALIVFASKGIWAISGSQGLGFSAVDYTVSKISTLICLGPSSFVDVMGMPCWWTADAIYILQFSQGSLSVQDITTDQIKDFILEIPLLCKKAVKGAFNPLTQDIIWLWNHMEFGTVTAQYEKDRALVYNLRRKAFNPWTISSGVAVHGIIRAENISGVTTIQDVVDGANDVVDGSDQVVAYTISQGVVTPGFKYLCSYDSGGNNYMTFAEVRNTLYLDWVLAGVSADYESYFVSGYRIQGNGIAKGQTNYVYLYARNDVSSQYYIQGIWNFATNRNSNYYGTKQRGTHDGENFKYKYHRFKFRGSGLCVQVRVSSVRGEPFDIIGWAVYDTANSIP
jgi:hypothetical protein